MLLISSVSASHATVWQGQYSVGSAFKTNSAHLFNFTVYDSNNISCYSNVTNITTNAFGQWVTEQYGVGEECNNQSADYYLKINIDGTDQLPLRKLSNFYYLRADVPMLSTSFNYSGIVRRSIQNFDSGNSTATLFSLANDENYLLTMTITSSSYFSQENNISFHNQPSIGQSSFNDMFFIGGRYTGFQWFTNPNNDTSNIISRIMALDRYGNLNITGNVTSNYLFGNGRYLTGLEKEVFFQVDPTDTNLGDFRTRSVGSGGIWRFDFYVPSDFSSLENIEVILIPVGTNAAAPVSIFSDCGAAGEPYNQHSGTFSTTWNLTASNIHAMNLSSALTDMGAGDFCGVQIDEGAFGSATNYLGIRLKYRT